MTKMTGKPNDNADAVMRGLVALDQHLREQQLAQALKGSEIAEPGAGLHTFLEFVAKQFFGFTPQGYPTAEAEPSKIEPGSISAQAIEAGRGDEGHHADKPSDGSKPHRR